MFFVSEEFLRKYEQGEDFAQTIDEAVKPGEGLFDQDYQTKADFKGRHRAAEPATESAAEPESGNQTGNQPIQGEGA